VRGAPAGAGSRRGGAFAGGFAFVADGLVRRAASPACGGFAIAFITCGGPAIASIACGGLAIASIACGGPAIASIACGGPAITFIT